MHLKIPLLSQSLKSFNSYPGYYIKSQFYNWSWNLYNQRLIQIIAFFHKFCSRQNLLFLWSLLRSRVRKSSKLYFFVHVSSDCPPASQTNLDFLIQVALLWASSSVTCLDRWSAAWARRRGDLSSLPRFAHHSTAPSFFFFFFFYCPRISIFFSALQERYPILRPFFILYQSRRRIANAPPSWKLFQVRLFT